MSLSLPTISTFEELPDEILLLICRYLSSNDILSAFYGLNARLSQTISGYCLNVSVGLASYKRLTDICFTILPDIGRNIHSLIVSDEWQGLLSKVFLEHFGERMSAIFPHLERLTLISFTPSTLKPFLHSLTNLFKLTELDIRLLHEQARDQEELWTLLHHLFTTNENRLTSILFDEDSTCFVCQMEDARDSYSNIEKLTIKLNTLQSFHNLLTTLPNVHSLDVTLEREDFEISEEQQLPPASALKIFFFRLTKRSTDLDQLITVLKRTPNVEELSLRLLSVSDSRLAHGPEFFSQLSLLPLKVFNYILFFFDSSLDKTSILSTWQQLRQESIRVENDNSTGFVLYTLPCISLYLALSYSLTAVFRETDLLNFCGQTVRSVSLYDMPSDISETYAILTKCRRVKRLNITIYQNVDLMSNRKVDPCKLPFLTSLVLLDTHSTELKDFLPLITGSPHLHDLTVYSMTLQLFFNDDSICRIFRERITHLKIYLDSDYDDLDTFPMVRLASILPNLKCLHLALDEVSFEFTDLFLIAAFNQLPVWNALISLTVSNAHITEELCEKGIQQWISAHISAYGYQSFLADYTRRIFRLWL